MSFEAGKDSIETEFPDGTYYLHRPLTNESPLGVSRDEDGFVGAGEGYEITSKHTRESQLKDTRAICLVVGWSGCHPVAESS